MRPISRVTLWTLLLIAPALAVAHPASGALNGWNDGFNHPIHGWDHLLAMIGVGLWAAQQRGRLVWIIPLTFVSIMILGGIAGVAGLKLPGVDFVIFLSVVVLGTLVIRRTVLPSSVGLVLVALFAFFHGFAHGAEMPGTATFITFGLGFILATLLLHALGLVTGRVAACLLAFLVGGSAAAHEVPSASRADEDAGESSVHASGLDEVVVLGRADSLLGIADSASEGNIGQAQLEMRPILRPGEVLETVPGLIVSQHSGEGKANQYYLRGFNLDHGTDFLTQIDGVPVNLVSHAHGQGWTDTGFLIPELVRTIEYQKGVYYAQNGDLSSAGAANIQYVNYLPDSLAKLEGGSFNYARALLASSHKFGEGQLLYALEGNYNDGPWQHGNHYHKANGLLRYARDYGQSGWDLTLMGYQAKWNATDQIALRAVAAGLIDRFGALDPTDGGNSQRYSLTGEWHRQDSHSATKFLAYGYYYGLDLFSDFTYFLSNPQRGDQFEQPDKRRVTGLKLAHSLFHTFGHSSSTTMVGLQARNDSIHNGLFLTEARQRYDRVRQDFVRETSLGAYFSNKTSWTQWFRSTVGVRYDEFRFAVDSNLVENSGVRTAGLASPKINLVFGPWKKTEIYASGGFGFHSNDARGVTTRVDPATGSPIDSSGQLVKPAQPLVRSKGAELGVRTNWFPDLQSTVTAWLLDLSSELVFSGDSGTTQPSRPSRRYGVELANYYSPYQWLTLDADVSLSHTRFTESAPEGPYVPGSVESVIAAGATVHNARGFFGGVRLRYFGPRPLIEDDSVRSHSTSLVSADAGYDLNDHWRVQAEVFNLLNGKSSAIDYYYASRLAGEPLEGVNDIHFHPVEPISFRIGVTGRF
ncbi:MAG: TonB-dependent receptor [Gammaproteobacteria bacterium]|nr:TonB-dependent receptor [Gammaproteobacteria bacterium]